MGADAAPLSPGWSLAHRRARLALVVAFSAFYGYHLSPEVQWGEPARRASFVLAREVRWLDGGNHALGTVIGIAADALLPFDTAFVQNLLSAAFGVLTLAVLYRLFALMGLSWLSALGAAAAFGVSHTFWFLCEVAETYTLATFLLALYLLACWRLKEELTSARAACVILIPAVASLHHMVFFLFPPVAFLVFAAVLEGRLRRLWWIWHGTLLAGGLVWVLSGVSGGEAFLKTVRDHFHYWFFPGLLGRELAAFVKYLAFQFPGPAFVLAIWGGWTLIRQDRFWGVLLGGFFLVVTLFSSSYAYNRKFYILVLAYLLFSLGIGWGLEALRHRRARFAVVLVVSGILFPPAVYWGTCLYLRETNRYLVTDREIPYRDVRRYLLWPGKHGDDGCLRFCQELLRAAGPSGLVLADYTIFAPLKYVCQAEGGAAAQIWMTDTIGAVAPEEVRREIARVIDAALAKKRPVILATPESIRCETRQPMRSHYEAFPWLQTAYRVEKAGNAYRVLPGGERLGE